MFRKRKSVFGCSLLLVLSVFYFAVPAFAGVSLTPRVKQNGVVPNDGTTPEDFVYFGSFQHMTGNNGNTPESEATPVLWRVMSSDADVSPIQAILLSHYLVSKKAYDAGNDNTWTGSDLQLWLNGDTGFGKAFTSEEWGAMLTYPDGSGGKVTLPSGESRQESSFWNNYLEVGELWFGKEESGGSSSFYNNARKAHFKGATFTYDSNENGYAYWTRSPYSGDANSAWNVFDGGALYSVSVRNTFGVRPAFCLNLESLIFKSASVFSSSAGAAGSRDNPYLLYLSAVASEDLTASATVTGSLKGNKLTLSFSGMPLAGYPNVFHAYMDYVGAPAPNNLKTAFTLSDAAVTVTAVEFKGASIELTLSKNYAYGETAPTLSYLGNAATDGIGFVNTGTVPTRLDAFSGLQATNDTPPSNPGGGDPVTNPTPTEAAQDFNDKNKNKGVQVEFPNVSFTDPNGVKDQLDGLTPNILGSGGISRTTLTPTQGDDENYSFFGKGWGAKIDIQLKSSTAAGRIDILPIKLTFLLDSADLKEAGWTDTDVAGNTAAFLAKALLTKVLAEGDQGEHDLTALLADLIAVKSDGRGGVTVELPFLLANGKGDPKLITDGGKKYLAIFDGERNGWLRDPVWLYRRAVVPTAITLTATPAPLTLKKGESGAVKAAFTPADATERDLVWSVSVPAVASVTKASAEDTWTVKGLSEGTAILTATASADSKVKATVAVTVTPAESDLFKTFAVSPEPPYRRGTEIEILASLNRAASSVKATVKRPDGGTDTPTVNVEGTEVWTAYTLETTGNYTVTVEAVDAATGEVWSRMAVLTVEEGGATGSSSSGGCNAAGGMVLLPLVFLGLSRTRKK